MRTHSLDFWYELRTDYIRLCSLCQMINEHISIQITVGIACNFWYVVIDIFRIVRLDYTTSFIFSFFFNYFNYSLDVSMYEYRVYMFVTFHAIQIFCVGLYAAWVNDESKKPLTYLNNVPTYNYNVAVYNVVLREK